MLGHLLNLIKGNKNKKFTTPKVEEVFSSIKLNKNISISDVHGSFVGDFKYPREKVEVIKDKSVKSSMEMTEKNKSLLKESIVISLYDFGVERPDLQFIGNSRIDGRPIYRYIGNDFSKFDLPYDELVSLGSYEDVSHQKDFSDYVSTIIDQNISYVDYLSETLDRSLTYSEEVAESIFKNH